MSSPENYEKLFDQIRADLTRASESIEVHMPTMALRSLAGANAWLSSAAQLLVKDAREAGLSWNDIGIGLGITAAQARRRFT